MKVIAIASLLLCALAVFVSAGKHHNVRSSPTIELNIFPGSNKWWIAVAVNNADVDTKSMQIKDSKSAWELMVFNEEWGYWTVTNPNGLEFPVSILLTSVDGETITLDDVITLDSVGATIETSVQYDSVAPASALAARSNKHATTTTTRKHSTPTTTTTTTKAPKKATTTTTTTKKGTTTTTTKAPSTSGSSSGSSGSGCSAGLKLMVPLYSYPGSDWDTVAASGSVVPTVAIINPNSGPGTGPDSSYTSYMSKLHAAGVEMVGYVHTSYGARSLSDVQADIDVYATKFSNLVGIFLDEASASSSEVSYYSELYSYIMSKGWKYDILNPGAVAATGYNSVATQIVSYESTASGFASSANPSGASCNNKSLYAVITYSASSASSMESVVDAAVSKGYYGWVYATSGTLSGDTYGSLPSYYAQMASYIASKN